MATLRADAVNVTAHFCHDTMLKVLFCALEKVVIHYAICPTQLSVPKLAIQCLPILLQTLVFSDASFDEYSQTLI